MHRQNTIASWLLFPLLIGAASTLCEETKAPDSGGSEPLTRERVQRFDRDPHWDSYHNRAADPRPRTIRQDFGYSKTNHAGGKVGELGGFLSPAAEPAYYAKKIPARSFADTLTASGTLACSGRGAHALIGFFNADTLNEWRTPNTIALRISARGDVFYAWVEYASGWWRAGGDEPRGFPTRRDPTSKRNVLIGFTAKGTVHRWSLRYDPQGHDGDGVVTATIDDQTAVCHLRPDHKADGATFNRFGLLNVMKSAADGSEIWLDDVTINDQKEDFRKDPGWDGLNNRRSYESKNVRPRFDFGYSPTHFADGLARGELGGLIFRGDCRYPERMASYADRLERLDLRKPLKASGKVSLRRGVTDSTVLLGFFHAKDSMTVNPSQDSGLPREFLGIVVDGPSREGFYFAPAYRLHNGKQGHAGDRHHPPHVYPDGKAHDWTLEYSPSAASGKGRITLTLDRQGVTLDLQEGQQATGAHFDRFGLVTTWVDGNAQHIYFDDLTYTCEQK